MHTIRFDRSTPIKVIRDLSQLIQQIPLKVDKTVIISYSSPAKSEKGVIYVNKPHKVRFILNKPELLKFLNIPYILLPKGEVLIDEFTKFLPGIVIDPVLPIKYVEDIDNLKIYFDDYGGRLYPCLVRYYGGQLSREEITYSHPLCKRLGLDFCSLIKEDDRLIDILPEVSIDTLLYVLQGKGII